MKSKIKTKTIILIILGINLAILAIINNNLVFDSANINKNSVNKNAINLDQNNLILSQVSSKIHIIGNSGWLDFKNAGNCTGEGTPSDPYIIGDLEIDGKYSGDCILIENSSAYFKIKNCVIYNSEDWYCGILLINVTHAQLIKNTCRSNWVGIDLWLCYNNTISANNARSNRHGIGLIESNNTTLSGNTVNDNEMYGILLRDSHNNTISKNIAENNIRGISVEISEYNNIYLNCFSKNILNSFDDGNNNQWDNGNKGNYWDDYTGLDVDSNGIGDVPYNISGTAGSIDNFPLMKCPFPVHEVIPGFNLIFLIGFIFVSLIIISKNLVKSRKIN